MKYFVIAHILNVDNFYKEYDNYDEAKKKYDKLLERTDCSYAELRVICASTIHKIDKRLDVYTVRYYDYGDECEQDFLSREEAEQFVKDYAYKYDNMEIY